MTIFTSYYDNIKNIPDNYFLISVSGEITDEIKESIDLWDRSLAPSLSIYNEYKETGDWQRYTERFISERIIDWNEKINNWKADNIVLLCYEKPNEFCHRQRYTERFISERIIDWNEKINNWKADNIVLLCYEKPNEFCHRHILAEQILKHIIVKEYGFENNIRKDHRIIL